MTPLVYELVPCPDAWEVARKLAHLPHLLFLDSAGGGHYSYVMADMTMQPVASEGVRGDLFEWLRKKLLENNCERLSSLPPFQGGYAGLFNYDLSRQIERLPAKPHDISNIDESKLVCYRTLISFDHSQKRAWIISSDDQGKPGSGQLRLNWLRNILAAESECYPEYSFRGNSELPERAICTAEIFPGVYSNFTRREYIAAVNRVLDYIRAGDVFQVNLSQRLLAPLKEHPLALYDRLRRVSPAPFAGYFDAGMFQVLSASPERFLKVDADRIVSTKPIKGTRARGRTAEEDATLLKDLTGNPKDRSENVMIVDLLRNDIGKVSEYGSVQVHKVCEVETYDYVHHLVSEVRGVLRQEQTPCDLLRAAFPGGSVTGAPKVRAMEIIAELEPTARGPYCGSLGFISFDGIMDTNILIRTFTAAKGWLQFPVGGGIVADSDPVAEYDETLTKAHGLLRSLRKTGL